MTPINTVGWMCWQYINNYFWQGLNSIVWVSVGWLILPEDRYVWPEFYDRCQIYRNVVWGRSSYWQSNEKPVGRLMWKLNCVVPPSLCVLISDAGADGKGLSSASCGPRVGEVWRSNNINQYDTLTFIGRSKIKQLFEGRELLRGVDKCDSARGKAS